ncbi:MAG: HEAT repeat domain-containing protein [Gammaproteobacteria bacterium]|nr:HEAT repeat domain-containing protein [Gammaproteobacteria bacterium]
MGGILTVNAATMSASPDTTPPDALLLIANGCPHCPTVLQGLSELVKTGHIGRLEVVNIGVHPEIAQTHGARAVPWLRLGPFVLTGLQAPAELAHWAERAQSSAAINDYVRERLADGDLAAVLAMLQHAPQQASALVHWLGDPQAELQVRLGAAAVLEHLEGSETLASLIDALTTLTRHADPRIRMDAVYALGLTHRAEVRPILAALREDADAEVRETVHDSLLAL